MRIVKFIVAAFLIAAPAHSSDGPATLTITGEGRVELAPDMATISLGVVTEDRAAAVALKANSENLAAVMSELKSAGVAERDIQTSGLSLNPSYDYGSGARAPVVTGYVATNIVTVRVRDLTQLGALLDTVVVGGANSLNGLSFGLQDDAEARDEARRRAVQNAAHKAALYADAAGVDLGRLLSMSEGGQIAPNPGVFAAESFAKGADVPVAAGELSVADTVVMVYEISQ